MNIYNSINTILLQLINSLNLLSDTEYNIKSKVLNSSSIGGHTRHIIECYNCLINGYDIALVNYEKRKRDIEIETNKTIAISHLKNIMLLLNKEDKVMQLGCSLSKESDIEIVMNTNYCREVLYNMEHTIHHMALLRIGINDISKITLPEDYGVASATLKHNQLCVQ